MRPLHFALLVLLNAAAAFGATKDDSALAEGRALAKELISMAPSEGITNTGTLLIKDKGGSSVTIPVSIVIKPGGTNWTTIYQTTTSDTNYSARLVIHHTAGRPNRYEWATGAAASPLTLSSDKLMTPFANSDFWVADLGLEFLHWPGQKILRKELRRGQSCRVLESTLTTPAATGYVKVVSWIDIDTGGIVDAYAYDSAGKEFKHFYPKSFRKVEGRYELKRIDITSPQSGSTTTLNFDSPKRDTP